MDVIFYFVVSLLVATIFCYLVFLLKNGFQREDIKKETAALQTVGTDQQKEEEKTVVDYQGKIKDFTNLLNNHEFASNVFAFMQTQTMPSIWFKQFSLDEKNAGVQLSGEADSMDAFSRQVAVFEKNKYVTNIASLNSSLGDSARTQFSINLVLSQDIFSYISVPQVLEPTTLPDQSSAQQGQTPEGQTVPENTAAPEDTAVLEDQPAIIPQQNPQDQAQAKSSEKLITSFHLLLNPEVIGLVDQANYTITLNVPYSTDVKNLAPSIVISPEATVFPASNVSQDFENPVIYIVTAQDSSVQSYEVKVVISPPPAPSKKTSQSGNSLLIILAIAGVVVVVTAIILIFVWKKMKVSKHNF